MFSKRVLFLAVLCIAFHSLADACRYNVRDVGFVDFGSDPYRLYGFVDGHTPDELTKAFQRTSFAAFLDANIESDIVNVDAMSDGDAETIYDAIGRPAAPAVALRHPDGRVMQVSMDGSETFEDAVWNTMTVALASPTRDSIVEQCIDHYAVVLMVEGADDAENSRVMDICMKAVKRIEDNMDNLPKAVKNPPAIVTVPADQRGKENVLLWSMGIDSKRAGEPAVAVMYGRGRRLGDTLIGKRIRYDDVFSILAIVGLSCECGLDRQWMMGTMIPLSWDEDRQANAAKELAFDTENPMVKTEISQIIAKGMNAKSRSDILDVAASNPLLGYQELTVSNPAKTKEITEVPKRETVSKKSEKKEIQTISQSRDQNPIVEPEFEISTHHASEQERVLEGISNMQLDEKDTSSAAIAMNFEQKESPQAVVAAAQEAHRGDGFSMPKHVISFLWFCIGVMITLCGLTIIFVATQYSRNEP